MKPLLIIRPEPGAAATLAAARSAGLEAYAEPLFEVRPRAWSAPDPASIDGLLIGSANALRHAGPQLSLYAGKPVYAVGAATMAAAEAAGLVRGSAGTGGLQEVLDALPPSPLRLLRLAGAVHVALRLPETVRMETAIVYHAAPVPLGPQAQRWLGEGETVALLHSAAAARHFAAEVARCGVEPARIAIAALGPRIAAAAGPGWAAVRSAVRPDDAALLALAREMCQ